MRKVSVTEADVSGMLQRVKDELAAIWENLDVKGHADLVGRLASSDFAQEHPDFRKRLLQIQRRIRGGAAAAT